MTCKNSNIFWKSYCGKQRVKMTKVWNSVDCPECRARQRKFRKLKDLKDEVFIETLESDDLELTSIEVEE